MVLPGTEKNKDRSVENPAHKEGDYNSCSIYLEHFGFLEVQLENGGEKTCQYAIPIIYVIIYNLNYQLENTINGPLLN